MYDIVAIGSVTHDNFLELDYQLIDWPNTPSKKAIVFPWGEKMEVRNFVSTLGGNAANASITFSRQGFRTACFGKIGKDPSGTVVLDYLRKDRVDSLLVSAKDLPTAYSVLLLKNGERTILGYHGVSSTLSQSDVPWPKLKSRWWYLSLSGESDRLLKSLLAFAKQNQIAVAFNPSGHHIHHRRKEILHSLPHLALLVLNAGEAADLTEMSFRDEKAVFAKLDRLTPGIVAVTDGPRGVTVSDGRYLYRAGIFPEKKLVDRTGAGDAFGSGLVAGLMHSVSKNAGGKGFFSPEEIEYAIRLATANAAAVVEKIGGTPGILTVKEFASSSRFRRLAIHRQKI